MTQKNILLIIAAVIVWIAVVMTSETDPDRLNQKAEQNLMFDASWACQKAVKNQLKAPATAVFADITEVRGRKEENKFTIYSHVDSQNGFGALVRTRFICTAIKAGETWTIESILPLES